MRKLVYLSLQNNEAQRVVSLWRPKLYRTDDTVGSGGRVSHAGTRVCPCRERPRAGQSGPEVGTLDADPGNAVVMASVTVQGQIFTGRVRGGKLKTWKSEKLTSRPAPQLARIPEFQVFRISPDLSHPKSCRMSPHGVGSGNVLNNAELPFPGQRKHH